MIQYGSVDVRELKFMNMRSTIELRDEQWVDVEVCFDLDAGSELPEELSDLSALLICTYSGGIAQVVPQDEGRDCEFQFTESEKEQLRLYYEYEVKPLLLSKTGVQ
ncbi:hypothetical protein [Paenibacillus sp. OAS669]|uniref:hypothetical protein n=1 Tax=Paenibacillus sp. OAS669 TaxID=2663821 RepID=UPI0017892C73|nr:hypothetical protein [Paenibacillus sp. OAS669]MBE1441889.1 hypothetical protein [Paenibacillus sp. OAS669]